MGVLYYVADRICRRNTRLLVEAIKSRGPSYTIKFGANELPRQCFFLYKDEEVRSER